VEDSAAELAGTTPEGRTYSRKKVNEIFDLKKTNSVQFGKDCSQWQPIFSRQLGSQQMGRQLKKVEALRKRWMEMKDVEE